MMKLPCRLFPLPCHPRLDRGSMPLPSRWIPGQAGNDRKKLVFHVNDHPPPHAHAIGADWEIKVGLADGQHRKPWLMEVTGDPTHRQLRQVLRATDQQRETLITAWRKWHADPTT